MRFGEVRAEGNEADDTTRDYAGQKRRCPRHD